MNCFTYSADSFFVNRKANTMKKIICYILTFIICILLCSCEGNMPDGNSVNPNASKGEENNSKTDGSNDVSDITDNTSENEFIDFPKLLLGYCGDPNLKDISVSEAPKMYPASEDTLDESSVEQQMLTDWYGHDVQFKFKYIIYPQYYSKPLAAYGIMASDDNTSVSILVDIETGRIIRSSFRISQPYYSKNSERPSCFTEGIGFKTEYIDLYEAERLSKHYVAEYLQSDLSEYTECTSEVTTNMCNTGLLGYKLRAIKKVNNVQTRFILVTLDLYGNITKLSEDGYPEIESAVPDYSMEDYKAIVKNRIEEEYSKAGINAVIKDINIPEHDMNMEMTYSFYTNKYYVDIDVYYTVVTEDGTEQEAYMNFDLPIES